MPGTLHDYAAAVSNVIATCRDAEQGFRGAADAVKDPALKELFEQYSEQRGFFAGELQAAVKSMGFDTTHPTGVAGIVHGAWMTVKGVVTRHNDHAVLVEAERGEDWSMKAYREAMNITLPPEIRTIIEKQFEHVSAAHDRIKALRDAMRKQKTVGPAPNLPDGNIA